MLQKTVPNNQKVLEAIYVVLNSSKKRTKKIILRIRSTQDKFFSVRAFGRNEDTMI